LALQSGPLSVSKNNDPKSIIFIRPASLSRGIGFITYLSRFLERGFLSLWYIKVGFEVRKRLLLISFALGAGKQRLLRCRSKGS
jgi:hypothetical protein